MTFVLDNSIALAWCFEDEQTPAIMSLLDRLTDAGASAPTLWPLEALNGLLMAERRQRIDGARRARLMGFLRDLPIVIDPDTAENAWEATIRLAERFRLTGQCMTLPTWRSRKGAACQLRRLTRRCAARRRPSAWRLWVSDCKSSVAMVKGRSQPSRTTRQQFRRNRSGTPDQEAALRCP